MFEWYDQFYMIVRSNDGLIYLCDQDCVNIPDNLLLCLYGYLYKKMDPNEDYLTGWHRMRTTLNSVLKWYGTIDKNIVMFGLCFIGFQNAKFMLSTYWNDVTFDSHLKYIVRHYPQYWPWSHNLCFTGITDYNNYDKKLRCVNGSFYVLMYIAILIQRYAQLFKTINERTIYMIHFDEE
jgi:hypothetical protein